MKLRNKKTGAIYSIEDIDLRNNVDGVWLGMTCYKSLASLNAEWEDVQEELKEYWYIDYDGGILLGKEDSSSAEKMMINIGNHFDSLEEAEKAVEKLKALKRLKDKGFVWQGWEEGVIDNGMCVIGCQISENDWETDVVEDLDLLFGGEK